MENKIRSTLNEIYFGKTRDIVNDLRYMYLFVDGRKFSNILLVFYYRSVSGLQHKNQQMMLAAELQQKLRS